MVGNLPVPASIQTLEDSDTLVVDETRAGDTLVAGKLPYCGNLDMDGTLIVGACDQSSQRDLKFSPARR